MKLMKNGALKIFQQDLQLKQLVFNSLKAHKTQQKEVKAVLAE